MCTSYSFIDASTNEGYEEEDIYEEEEDLDQYPNQGKLYCIASYCYACKLFRDPTTPKFYSFFIKAFLIVNFGVS